MINPAEVHDQLQNIHRNRNLYIWVPNSLLILSSTYFHRNEFLQGDLWWIALGCVLLAVGMRAFLFQRYFEEWKKNRLSAHVLNYSSLVMLTGGWMLHFWAVRLIYGGESTELSHTMIFVAGLIAGANVSLSVHRPSFVLYVTVMCLVPICSFLTDGSQDNNYVVFFILVFYFFNLYNVQTAFQQLKRSVENEILARTEKERQANLIDTVPGFVGMVNDKGIFTMANHTTLTAYPGIIGKKLGEVDPNNNWEKSIIDFMQSDRNSVVSEEKSIMNGKTIHALMNLQKVAEGVIIVSLMTNELVEAREQLREQEAKAQYSARLASLGEVAAGIAHEINNPLTIIQGSSSILSKIVSQEPVDKEMLKTLTSKIINTTERITKIVKSLKNLSRKGDNDPVSLVELNKIIEQCLDVTRERLNHLEIRFIVPDFKQPAYFKGRDVQISQVMVNLISNSVDAVKSLEERWIKITYEVTAEHLVILISDSGRGIGEHIRTRIMEPFFTTKDVNQGTGLGLSISKSIIESHGGTLVYDDQAANTTFRISLPLPDNATLE